MAELAYSLLGAVAYVFCVVTFPIVVVGLLWLIDRLFFWRYEK